MSMRSLESAVLAGAKFVFNNSRLRLKDIVQWSTGEIEPRAGEVVLWIADPGVYVAVEAKFDKRVK